jgi:hypothetical protein
MHMIDLRLPTGFPTTSTRALFSHLNHACSPPLPSPPPPPARFCRKSYKLKSPARNSKENHDELLGGR